MSTEAAEKQFEFEGLSQSESQDPLVMDSTTQLPRVRRRAASGRRIKLSARDFEILEFILEMRFASLDEVCAKFFKGSPNNKTVDGQWYAMKRLPQLEKAGYLGSSKRFSETKRLYFANLKAYFLLNYVFPEKNLPRPTETIDARTVVHDYIVLRLRLELEKREIARSWISDRSLKVQTGILGELSEGYSPDGIYKTSDGPSVAFELEIALKSKARYQDKIRRYVQWLREHRNNPEAFKKVHFVTTNESVKKHLDNFTAMYRELFKIEMVSEYITESVGLK
jgi:hypothetical protein